MGISGNERVTLGKSILVPSVQELANTSLVAVPERYIRDDQDAPILAPSDHQMPIVNLELLISGDGVELQKLHSACKEWGFFQKFKLETQDFLNLPLEEKKRYWQTPTDVEGFGQAFVTSEEQKLDWADMFYLTTLPKYERRPNLLPMLPLPYRDTLESYSKELQKLALKILDCMTKALDIKIEVFRAMLGEGHQSIRMNYYPPCPQPDKVIGLSPHTDAAALITILLQFDETEGLQVIKGGKWIPVKPLPDAFVVNIGDILEIMTNGIYQSVVHRAIVNATKERLSVATFYNATKDREIGPISSLITPETPAKFKNISMVDYWKGFLARPLDGKSYLNCLKINENYDTKEQNKS